MKLFVPHCCQSFAAPFKTRSLHELGAGELTRPGRDLSHRGSMPHMAEKHSAGVTSSRRDAPQWAPSSGPAPVADDDEDVEGATLQTATAYSSPSSQLHRRHRLAAADKVLCGPLKGCKEAGENGERIEGKN